MPQGLVAQRLIELAGPIAAPSANVSGRPSPVTAMHVYQDMQGRIPLVIDGGCCEVGVESTVVDATKQTPVILRPGHITREQIAACMGHCLVAGGVLQPVTGKALSPGMLHKHYAPEGKAVLVSYTPGMTALASTLYDQAVAAGKKAVIIGRSAHAKGYGTRTFYPCDMDGSMAKGLFAMLRRADDENMAYIILEGANEQGEDLAYMNRALRAAGFHRLQAEE